jgi:hypothetical protein
MLELLNITPASEELGESRSSTLEYNSGGLFHEVLPFACAIKPRTAKAAVLIAQAAKDT